MQQLDKCDTINSKAQPADTFVDVRGADGRLYGRIDIERMLFKVKKGRQSEVIDLKRCAAQTNLSST